MTWGALGSSCTGLDQRPPCTGLRGYEITSSAANRGSKHQCAGSATRFL